MKHKFSLIWRVAVALVLVLSFSLVAALPVGANPGEWYVATTGSDITGDGTEGNPWATIQFAIDNASATDTITVADGTYEPVLSGNDVIVVDKALTLQAAPDSSPVIVPDRAGGSFDYGVIGIEADGVTIDGFNIQNDDPRVDPPLFADIGILVRWGENFVIQNNTITGFGDTDEIYENSRGINTQATGVGQIKDNILEANRTGIEISSSTGVTIQGNLCQSNRYGIALFNSTGITVTQNKVYSNTCGISAADSGGTTSGTFHNNNIVGNTMGFSSVATNWVSPGIGNIDATDNWWGDASGPYLVNGVGDKISPNVNARVWLDAAYPAGKTTGLKVGETYDLYIEYAEGATNKVYLDDIQNDPLLPVDSQIADEDGGWFDDDDIKYSLADDALAITLDADGKGTFDNIKPEYATDDLADGSDTPYIGISKTHASADEIYWLEATPAAAFSLSLSPETATVVVETGITATVTDLDGEPMAGVMVKYGYDADSGNDLDAPDEIEGSGLTDSAGQYAFSITAASAGNYIVVAVGADVDVGGLLGDPDEVDTIVDLSGERQSTVAVSPSSTYALTVTPSTLYSGWTYGANTIEVVVKDSTGNLVVDKPITYSASGCGITAIEDAAATTDATDGTFTIAEEVHPTATGSITLTVNRDTGGTSAADYTGSATITVSTADKFNVDISPSEIAAAAGSDITASFWDIDMNGADGATETSLLDNVKVTLSGVGVSETETIDDAATCTFTGVTPEQAGTITATFVGTYDDDSVETKTLDISVTGYKVIDLTPSTAQIIDTTNYISMTVTTAEDDAVNNALVTVTAAETAGFEKDVDDDGVLEAFQEIVIDGSDSTIAYTGTGVTDETFLVNDGFYQVTDITFAKPGAVKVTVEDTAAAVMAELPTAFTVVGPEVYTLSFEPTMLTAGVDGTGLEITITEDSVAVTDVATITVDGVGKTFSRVSNVYTVTAALLYTEEKTGEDALTVIAQNADASEIGTASLEVALPSVSYVITDAAEVERDLMLTGQAYTVAVTVTDALGEALANGKVSLGSYADTTFTLLTGMPVTLDGTGQKAIAIAAADGDAVTTGNNAGSLVWEVGDAANLGPALVLTPAITVEELYYDVNPTEATVGVETTYTVTDNYTDPAADRDVKIVTPAIETVPKTTGPAGTPLAGKFNYTATEADDYYVSVKLDATTWQEAIKVTVSEEERTLQSIEVTPATASIGVGGTQQFTATGTYNLEPLEEVITTEVTWASSDESKATIDAAGLATGVAEGSTNITATLGTIVSEPAAVLTVSAVVKGDFDEDGDIDLADFVEFAAAYGSSEGDPNYNVIGDFDDSGDIGLADFVEFAAVYGT